MKPPHTLLEVSDRGRVTCLTGVLSDRMSDMAEDRVTVRLPVALRRAVEQRAEETRRPVGAVVREALEQWLGVGPLPTEPLAGAGVQVGEQARPTHRHRMEGTGEFRFEGGLRVERFACECGAHRWGR